MGAADPLPGRTLAAGFSQGQAPRALAAASADPVIVTDASPDAPGPLIRHVNAAFTRLTGWAADEVIGRSPRILQGPATDPATTAAIGAALRQGRGIETRILNVRRDGSPYWAALRIVPLFDARGRIDGFAGYAREITQRAPSAGTPLDAAGPFCAAWLGLDDIAALQARDPGAAAAAVQGVATLLRVVLGPADMVARPDGTGFVIGMPRTGLAEARRTAERLRRAVAALPGPGVTCSIGLAAARDGETLGPLLARAEAALVAARRAGGNRVTAAAGAALGRPGYAGGLAALPVPTSASARSSALATSSSL